MATKLIVERIDILDGPNLKGLLQAYELAVPQPGGFPQGMRARFDRVVFYGRTDEDSVAHPIDELGTVFDPQVVGIQHLGGVPTPETRHDHIIKVAFGGWTFVGHYNTLHRKGCLVVVK